ncbi:GIY-YIG nuclease family protein [Nostoc sp. JL23]|uniref:GIY-YIG nuclease family protein n=1 Tax=Nostoc sp. JL23 TaxID=2815394 RepID=UPI0025CF52E0|nr:GIY-YIG nuclease family protein [Nostoc sp. JL23]
MILTEDVIMRYRANQGYVYLIHAIGTDRYKIGRSVNPVTRLETLKKQSPYPLQIVECFWTPDAIADERSLHLFFKQFRAHGEWFGFHEEINITGCKGYAADFGVYFSELAQSLFEDIPDNVIVKDVYRLFSLATSIEDISNCYIYVIELLRSISSMPVTFPNYHFCVVASLANGLDSFTNYLNKLSSVGEKQ